MLWLTISVAMLVVFLAAKVFFRRRPPEMSEPGMRHFQAGLKFAVVSSSALAGIAALSKVIKPQIFTWPPLMAMLWVIFLLGNLSNEQAPFASLGSCHAGKT